ncbi:MAG: FTR1 family protein [Xanthomonadales bacterium]
MLLTSVILILQETLEAALLFSILAVITLQVGGRPRNWLPWGLLAGGLLAWVYALNLRRISEWFDYVGQEVVNAALQLGIAFAIVLLAVWLGRRAAKKETAPAPGRRVFGFLCAATVALAITREGSEILVFLGGFLAAQNSVQALLTGSGIGFGIGVSVGFLLFYGLLALADNTRTPGRVLPLVLLALFGGNMFAQAAVQLMQADWLAAGPALWDSSAWLSEQSVTGRLLYALIGYESNPSATHVTAYLAGALAVPAAFYAGRRSRR